MYARPGKYRVKSLHVLPAKSSSTASHSTRLLLGRRKLQVDMKVNQMPHPKAEPSWYVAVCRLPCKQCIEYAYGTGKMDQCSEACMLPND